MTPQINVIYLHERRPARRLRVVKTYRFSLIERLVNALLIGTMAAVFWMVVKAGVS